MFLWSFVLSKLRFGHRRERRLQITVVTIGHINLRRILILKSALEDIFALQLHFVNWWCC